jgi:hypothetical protein
MALASIEQGQADCGVPEILKSVGEVGVGSLGVLDSFAGVKDPW